MKKIIGLVLSAALLISLSACGSSPEVEQPTEPPKEVSWELKDGLTLDIQGMEIEEITIGEFEEKFEIIKDPFGIDIDKARDVMSDEFDIELYHLHEYVSTTDDEIDGNWVYGHNYDISETIDGQSKNSDARLYVETTVDTTISNNPSSVIMTFYNVEPDKDGQQYVFEKVKALMGESWATYLVYAKDSDGLSQFEEELESQYNLEDFAQVGPIKILCKRTVESDNIRFVIDIERDGFNYCAINAGNYESQYDEVFKPRLLKVFPNATDDYTNCDNIFADFFNLNNADKLPNSRVDSVSCQMSDSATGKTYYVEIESMMYDKDDVSLEGDIFTIQISWDEDTEGNISGVLVRAYGDEMVPGHEDMKDADVLATVKPIISKKLTYLLKDIETFEDKWEIGEMKTFEGTYTVEGLASELDYMLDIHINPDDSMFSWNVQLTSQE